jgi:GTPase SAR1 family protein
MIYLSKARSKLYSSIVYITSMNRNQSYDCLIKLLVIGNSGVGKTNILLKYC